MMMLTKLQKFKLWRMDSTVVKSHRGMIVHVKDDITPLSMTQTPFLGGLSLHLNHLYSIAHDNLRLAIWDTSFWTFLVKFGHKGP